MAQQSQQATQAPQPELPAAAEGSKLTLAELTRVMDVARTLRKERSIAEQQLNLDETKALLREKLREAADLAGDPVTDAQIDAAIEHYYDNLHEFRPPESGLQTTLANLYVRRHVIVGWTIALAAAALLTWGFWFAGMIPGSRQTEMRARQTYSQVEQVVESIESVSVDPAVTEAARAAQNEAATYRDRGDLSALQELHDQLLNQASVLRDEYRLMIVSEGQSGAERLIDGENISGYYLIVEAIDSAGNVAPMRVRNAETGKHESVTKWGEQVPKEIFEQVEVDKKADGIVDAREFAVKERGKVDVEVTITGPGGQTVERGRQITQW